jgi:tellurite resistance protein
MRNDRTAPVTAGAPPHVGARLFAIPFSLIGLAGVWQLTDTAHPGLSPIPKALSAVAAIAWLGVLTAYLLPPQRGAQRIAAELRDPAASPFLVLPFLVGMLLAGVGLKPEAPTAARVLFLAFLVGELLIAGLVVGRWVSVRGVSDRVHPGFYLPIVGGGLLGAQIASSFGLRAIGWVCFGAGLLSWLSLRAVILNRLLAGLPSALVATIPIDLAPPAIAANAYFVLAGGRIDPIAYALAGSTAAAALLQIRLLPLFRRQAFSLSFWSLGFSWASVAALAVRWILLERPPGRTIYIAAILAAVSLLIAALAARSGMNVAQRTRWRRRIGPEP